MAFWGAPLDDEDQVNNATKAVLEMRVALGELNERLAKKAWIKLIQERESTQDSVSLVTSAVVLASIIVSLGILSILLLD